MQFPIMPTNPATGPRDTAQVREPGQVTGVRPVSPEAPETVPLPRATQPPAAEPARLEERRREDRRRRREPVLLDTRTGRDRRRSAGPGEAAARHIDERA